MTRTPVVTDARLRLGSVRLPALPEVLLKLLELYRRDDASIAEFAALIGADPAMAAKVMAAANSAAYRGQGPVHDLQRCLNVLGTETVRTIVISQAVFQAMLSLPLLRRVDLGPYWRHSLMAAAVARELAPLHSGVHADEAYLAGLLHDVGRLALLAAAPEFHAEGLPAADEAAQCVAERRWLQVDHTEAGGWLIDRWRLRRELGDSVRYHHEPASRLAGAEPLIRIVALAHTVAQEAPDPKVVSEAGALCGLELAQISLIAERARATLTRTAEQLGISIDDTGTPSRSSAAAERLESEVETMMIATTMLSDLPLQPDRSRHLLTMADAARIAFPFTEVVAMAPDGSSRLRRIGPGDATQAIDGWRDFSLPCGAETRIGRALAERKLLFVDREKDAGDLLSIAEDQLLRLMSAGQLVLLPIRIGPDQGAAGSGALICVGDRTLMADLQSRQSFLNAFAARADALRSRAESLQRDAQRLRDQQAASQQGSTRDLIHEISNPLAIVQNYLGVLDTKLGTSDALGGDELEDLSGDIAVLQQEVARVGRLVSTLASAEPAPQAAGVDVNRLIADVARLFRADARAAGIEVVAQGHETAHAPGVERDALEQVLVNLVKNAIEAMSTPAAVAAARPAGAQVVVANGGLVNRDGQLSLEITVRDNGPGMPGDMLTRLFAGRSDDSDGAAAAPAGGASRGRGLVIVHRLVRRMGGAILCRSSGAGTRFEILLPYGPAAQGQHIP